MFKALTQRSALLLALLLFTLPPTLVHAQSSATPTVVTGGDPQPTGEPDPPKPKTNAMPVMILTTLVALGLA